MRIFSGIVTVILKFLTVVVVPAASLLLKEFVNTTFPSMAREVYQNT